MLRLVLPFVRGGQGEALATTCHEFWHAYLPGHRSRIRAVRKVAMLAIRWKLQVRMWGVQCSAQWLRGDPPDRNTLKELVRVGSTSMAHRFVEISLDPESVWRPLGDTCISETEQEGNYSLSIV